MGDVCHKYVGRMIIIWEDDFSGIEFNSWLTFMYSTKTQTATSTLYRIRVRSKSLTRPTTLELCRPGHPRGSPHTRHFGRHWQPTGGAGAPVLPSHQARSWRRHDTGSATRPSQQITLKENHRHSDRFSIKPIHIQTSSLKSLHAIKVVSTTHHRCTQSRLTR